MENENKMTILQALKQLRDDIIKWVANNLRALSNRVLAPATKVAEVDYSTELCFDTTESYENIPITEEDA